MVYSISDFKKDFDHRHNFKYEDLKTLQKKYPNVCFVDIPEAWVIIIDDLLSSVDFISEVQQCYGFLSVSFKSGYDISERVINIINATEKRLYAIDADLHILLEAQ